ncbi:MAG: TadE/TadG family type IV pilus assembly protein [Terriglobales bacterium]
MLAPFEKRSERGGTLVEAAIVMMLLFTFIMAIIEFGRILSVYQTITNAAREGARFSVAPCQSGDPAQTTCHYTGPDGTLYSFDSGYLPSAATVKAYVENYLRAGAVKADTVRISGTDPVLAPECWETLTGISGGTPFSVEHHCRSVTVTATYRWLVLPFGNLPLRANSVMKDELDIER